MIDNATKGPLEDWREKFPQLFASCEASTDAAPDPWETALSEAEGHDKELLVALKQRLDASQGAVRLELTSAGARLEIDPAWASGHGEAVLDITALVYGTGAAAVRRWLLGQGEKVQ